MNKYDTKVWYAIPSKDPALCSKTFEAWKDMGYQTAVLFDGDDAYRLETPQYNTDMILRAKEYFGYPWAVRELCKTLAYAPIVVTGGDDILPDPKKKATEIAVEFLDHFRGTFGVMQPTGDRWMEHPDGTVAAERICGSPWMGREFFNKINQGDGPFWPGYAHFYCDEEMKEVTSSLGILWQRPDLCQMHNHWSRPGMRRDRPWYLKKAKENEIFAKHLFDQRKRDGFPGHQPLAQGGVK